MKVKIEKDGLLVVPETDFEEEYLRSYSNQKELDVFLKHGLTVKELIGLKVRKR